MMRTARNGFTLVEMAIALVIIGLLIGGILTAQSMISTAQIAAVASQIQQFDAGVMNFKTKFNYLPGDAPGFGGDGDGIIDDGIVWGDPYSNVVCANYGEIATFWNTLFPDKYLTGTYATPGSKLSKGTTPISSLGKSNSYFVASAVAGGVDNCTVDNSDRRNFYTILDSSNGQIQVGAGIAFEPSTSLNSAVKPAELLALDKKIDDGIANSGNIISGSLGIYRPGQGGIRPIASPLCSSGATYTVANTGYECTPLIRIGGQTGNPQ
jgi:prepilin-type N-terminal cleavage/methylation domain-containing protein